MVNKKRLKAQEIRQRQIENNNIGSNTYCDDTANKAIAKIYYTEQKIANRAHYVLKDYFAKRGADVELKVKYRASGNNFAYPKNKEK